MVAAGAYETGYINSLGDGAHGVEASVIVGKFWNRFGFSTEFGDRHRGSTEINEQAIGGTSGDVDVPSDVFYNLSAGERPEGDRAAAGDAQRVSDWLLAPERNLGDERAGQERLKGEPGETRELGGPERSLCVTALRVAADDGRSVRSDRSSRRTRDPGSVS